MMQKSDNTATDHIITLVGRENIEQTMAAMGHHDPSPTSRVLTREFALLKLGVSGASGGMTLPCRRRRAAADLAEEVDTMPEEALANLVPDRADRDRHPRWFATREDLADDGLALDERARTGDAPVTEVISLETQLPFDGEVWPYVGFKGGSELGVLSGTWLLQRADGRHFVYSVGFANLDAGIDLAMAAAAMVAGRDRLALTP